MDAKAPKAHYATEDRIGVLEELLKERYSVRAFLPQAVPNYAATEQFNELRKKYPDYGYKEATLNPTNPRDRAVEWEAELVNQFRNDAAKTTCTGTASTNATSVPTSASNPRDKRR